MADAKDKAPRGYADQRVPQELRGELARTRPPVKAEHAGRFRWDGPGMLKTEIGGAVPRHCFPTKVISIPEAAFGDAFAAGLQWVGWAAP